MNFLITLFSFFISFVATATGTTTFAYDQMGLEIQRLLPGQVQQTTTRDALGRPTEQLTGHASKRQRSRKYNWTTSNRLTQIIDSATGTTHFDYNKEGYLTQAKYADGTTTNRYPDAKGNLYEDANLKDREYAHGGKLVKKGSWHYKYNHQGFLTEKYKKTGSLFSFKEDHWKYFWNTAGLLESVQRPDGAVVSFGYDALGRRIFKHYKQTFTNFVWDGNVPLHEFKTFTTKDALSNDVITWLFEEDSFSPIAKLRGEKKYSILADHLGTPIEAYADDGNLVWERSLNANGKVLKETGIQNFCPFLYQGQSLDNEIELAYNRFRYYDPEDGRYISVDPIGLMGGMTFYGYVHDTNGWLDLFGLSKKKGTYTGNGKDLENDIENALIANGIPYKKNQKFGPNGSIGEIDFETDNAIIESTISNGGKKDQVNKLVNNKLMNPTGKPVIVHGPNYTNKLAIKDVEKEGGLVSNSMDDLISVIK
ncbi:MAG: RHS repeat-associated core domain-containing protein [Flavobacterium haoranii]